MAGQRVREREMTGLTAQLDQLAGHLDQAAAKPPAWAESLAEHIELLRTQVTPLAELPSLWAGLGTVAENVEQALPRLQTVCDKIGQALEALWAQDERLGKLQLGVGKLQQSMETAAGRFSRLDKAVAELAQHTTQLDKEISGVKGRTEVGLATLAGQGRPERRGHRGQGRSGRDHGLRHPRPGRDGDRHRRAGRHGR